MPFPTTLDAMLPTQLTTDRLVLSSPTLADAQAITDMCTDPESQKWTTVPWPYTLEDAHNFIEKIVPAAWEADSPTWSLREKAADGTYGRTIGTISLTGGHPTSEMGFMIAPHVRNKGYMSEAVQAVLDFAFDSMSLESVIWECLIVDGEPNWPSARVAWNAGFTFEGRIRKHSTNKGNAYDCLIGSILPTDPRKPQHPWIGPDSRHPAIGNPRDPEQLVRAFHTTYGLPIVEGEPNADRERVHMRLSLVAEECAELIGAVYGEKAQAIMTEAFGKAKQADDGSRDTVEVADAIGDLVYVAYGMALELGIPLADVLAEIQASNLSKLDADGKPIYREDGKVLKGPNYFRPNLRRVLGI